MTRPCRLNLMPLLTLLLAAAPAAQACGACGCTLNSDWASQGYALKPGLRFDLRQDYFNQDQLRAGTRSMGRGALDFPNDQEIQEQTLNRNTTLTLDYSPTVDWGVALVVPSFSRYHVTIAAGDTEPSFSRASGLGDVRVLGRYQGFRDDHSFGVQLGVKLPTGGTKQTFNAGAQAREALDRGLQLGTGTTDLLFALDSIPAIFGLTDEPYIVFAANVFALLGLRQLYFLLGDLLDRLVYLSVGLAIVLGFIGVKMILGALAENHVPFIHGGAPVEVWVPSTGLSLGFIVLVLAVTTVASLRAAARNDSAAATD